MAACMAELLNVDQALERILATVESCPTEAISLARAVGRILAEPLVAKLNLPPFANSSMDGYAIRAADSLNASRASPVALRVTQDIPAGVFPQNVLSDGEAARIMTGAPMPEGADAIIPVEDTNAQWRDTHPDQIEIYRSVKTGDYVRPIGESVREGRVVLPAGTLLRAAEIGILASLGETSIPVIRRPRVVILGSGNEVAEPGQPLEPGQIYDANGPMLATLVQEAGAEAVRLPNARDTLEDLRAVFQQAIDHKPDVIISSAGVSVGAADLTRQVLDELGQINFWRINLRPGKPLAYGSLGGVPFFGLPGNPVSAYVTFDVMVRPVLLKLGQMVETMASGTALAGEAMPSDGRRSYIRVTMRREGQEWIASETGTQSSGALMSLVMADALMIIPEDVKRVEAGTRLPVKWLKPMPKDFS
jgi:molybdopterin molybdotransferase